MRRVPVPSHPAHLVLGLLVWSVWFVVVYGGVTVGCVLLEPDPALGARTPVNLLLAALSAGVALALGLAAWLCWKAARGPLAGGPRRELFIARTSAALYLISAASTAFVGWPLLILPPCL
ncbi:hypothetical protein [Caldimonas tepidiphila]|uniref:hypothetical protein n=1 Tax=Caldimonas tepidiphila TaxID=2315841 RepID=UPI000E5AD0EE|nr:hypothetical protein [Caldimonas tepidiphila]